MTNDSTDGNLKWNEGISGYQWLVLVVASLGWGFDVFDDVLDHSYDNEDDGARINSLFEKNHEILSTGFPLDDAIKTRLEKNRTHYFTDFVKQLPDL